jgi:hypothetical protein
LVVWLARELRERINGSLSELVRSQFTDILQVEILLELLDGRRTVAELVAAIYGLGDRDPGFKTYYTRVSRSAAELRSRGFLSRRLLGKEKPYHITQLAVARMSSFEGVKATSRGEVVPRGDLTLYVSSLTLGLVSVVAGRGIISGTLEEIELLYLVVFSLFLLATGAALTRLYDAVRRVI